MYPLTFASYTSLSCTMSLRLGTTTIPSQCGGMDLAECRNLDCKGNRVSETITFNYSVRWRYNTSSVYTKLRKESIFQRNLWVYNQPNEQTSNGRLKEGTSVNQIVDLITTYLVPHISPPSQQLQCTDSRSEATCKPCMNMMAQPVERIYMQPPPMCWLPEIDTSAEEMKSYLHLD